MIDDGSLDTIEHMVWFEVVDNDLCFGRVSHATDLAYGPNIFFPIFYLYYVPGIRLIRYY